MHGVVQAYLFKLHCRGLKGDWKHVDKKGIKEINGVSCIVLLQLLYHCTVSQVQLYYKTYVSLHMHHCIILSTTFSMMVIFFLQINSLVAETCVHLNAVKVVVITLMVRFLAKAFSLAERFCRNNNILSCSSCVSVATWWSVCNFFASNKKVTSVQLANIQCGGYSNIMLYVSCLSELNINNLTFSGDCCLFISQKYIIYLTVGYWSHSANWQSGIPDSSDVNKVCSYRRLDNVVFQL